MTVRTLVAWLGAIGASAPLLAQVPVRDARPLPPQGTGTVFGIVVSAANDGAPLRGAQVMLTNREFAGAQVAITDETGAFRFSDLPAGRFSLSAGKPAYLDVSYGATRPGGAGTSIALGEGAVVGPLKLSMHRGGVIAGRITDERGRPMSNVQVSASRRVWLGGERRLGGAGEVVTDDEGQYRFFGLAAGEYAIRATPGSGGSIQRLSVGEIDAALDPRRSLQLDEPPDVTYGRSAIYFPGTPRQDEARLVQVRLGEETGGVDFIVRLVPTVRLSGDVTGGGVESSPEAVLVRLFGESFGLQGRTMQARGAAGQSKAFNLTGVPPGRYTVAVRVPGTAGDTTTWAAATVDVAGRSIEGIRLLLQPTFTISGVVRFENAATTPPIGDFQVAAIGDGAPEWGTDGPSPIGADGRFTITGVVPGRYRLRVQARTAAISVATTWFLKSAMVDGTDAVDAAVDLQPGGRAIEGIVATMSEQRTEVTGLLLTPEGQAVPDVHIVVFSADRRYWTGYSRRIQAVRPGSDGRYRIVGLPAGDYYLAALTDVEPGEWFSPDFLEALISTAAALRLDPAEKKTQDIRIGGAPMAPGAW